MISPFAHLPLLSFLSLCCLDAIYFMRYIPYVTPLRSIYTSVSCIHPSGRNQLAAAKLFAFVLLVALNKRIFLKICFLSCFVRLKCVLFNLLCGFDQFFFRMPAVNCFRFFFLSWTLNFLFRIHPLPQHTLAVRVSEFVGGFTVLYQPQWVTSKQMHGDKKN